MVPGLHSVANEEPFMRVSPTSSFPLQVKVFMPAAACSSVLWGLPSRGKNDCRSNSSCPELLRTTHVRPVDCKSNENETSKRSAPSVNVPSAAVSLLNGAG